MNLLLHHLRKDFGYLRWWMIGTWIIAGCMLLWPLIPRESRANYTHWVSLVSLAKYVMVSVTVWRLIQLDAPKRDKAFFQTKPTSLTTVLRSKLLVIITLIVPLALMECLFAGLLGLHPGIPDQILIFSEALLSFLFISLLLLAVATLKASPSLWHRRFVGTVVAIFVGYFTYRLFHPDCGISYRNLSSSRSLMAQFIGTVGILLGLLFTKSSQSPQALHKVLEVSILSALAAWFFWPVDFVGRLTPMPAQAAIAEQPTRDSFKIKFTASDENLHDGMYFDRSPYGIDSRPSLRINARYRLSGLPEGWWPSIGNGYSSEAVFKSDSPVMSYRELSPNKLFAKTIFRKIGIMRKSANETIHLLTLARIDMAENQDATKISSLRGSVEFSLARPVVLARQALVQCRSFPIPGQSVTITKVRSSSERIDYSLELTGIKLRLRGGDTAINLNPIQFLVINRKRNEYLEPGSMGSRSEFLGNYQFSTLDFSCVVRTLSEDDSQVGVIASDWLADAELLIVGSEHGGTFSQGFEFSNIDLSRKQ
ncbi:MAG: hypothetical protein ABI600_06090 [Luteolibacter sp.]